MDAFLTPVSTTKVKQSKPVVPVIEELSLQDGPKETPKVDLKSPERILEILKNQPGQAEISIVLDHLAKESRKKDGFNLIVPSPVVASIVDTLVNKIIPDYWPFRDHKTIGNNIVRCLRNPNGIGAFLSKLRPLTNDLRQKKAAENTRDSSQYLEGLLNVLEMVLRGTQTSSRVLKATQEHAQNAIQEKLMWKEYLAQVASGRVISLVAEAEDALKARGSTHKASWLASGHQYAAWLGGNIAMVIGDNDADAKSAPAVVEVCAKALGLGYTGDIVRPIVEWMVDEGSTEKFERCLRSLKAHEQRKYLHSMISCITTKYLDSVVEGIKGIPLKPSIAISGAASLLHILIQSNELLQDHVVTTLVQSSTPGLDDSLPARRSVLAAIAQHEEKLQTLLEKCIRTFGDSFYVKHTPILQQETLAQTLVITCGYVQRSQPMFLTMMAKSSYQTAGMSNRVGATSTRARLLGMAVGMAMSKMVDKPELQLNFHLEGDEAVEAKWYEELTKVIDRLGDIGALKTAKLQPVLRGEMAPGVKKTKSKPQSKNTTPSPSIIEITGPRIVELVDESSDEDDDLIPYAKPDSDPEDDTDDPTEINRNKPTAPVYVRDLIASLQDQENYDRHQLALSTAASLIRRKANFGTEVTDHIEQLATILTGLNDNFDLPEFATQRQQALIAVLLAKPGPMAQWFARSFFSGDYSISQRTAMLSTLGLGARELAGMKDSSTDDLMPPTLSFPSKQLPPSLHKIYADSSSATPVSRITGNLTQQLLSPIAAEAADQLNGPSILQVGSSRTFSSRMEVEARRSKLIPNALAQIVANNFFFPLTGRFFIAMRPSNSSDSVYTSTHLLPAFLQTLALLLHASGPSTLSLPQMTRELWELLLSVRALALNDKSILSALLFAFLMLLETNEDKQRLATDHGRELLETQEWTQMVFKDLGAGSEEDEKVRVLAAGVVVRCQEVVEKYQRRLAGRMLDY